MEEETRIVVSRVIVCVFGGISHRDLVHYTWKSDCDNKEDIDPGKIDCWHTERGPLAHGERTIGTSERNKGREDYWHMEEGPSLWDCGFLETMCQLRCH